MYTQLLIHVPQSMMVYSIVINKDPQNVLIVTMKSVTNRYQGQGQVIIPHIVCGI